MKTKLSSSHNVTKVVLFGAAAFVVCGFLFFGNLAKASTTLNVSSNPASISYRNAVIKVADRLVATQNSDGGWEWSNPDTNSSTGIPSPSNTLGVTADALVDAYRLTHQENYLTAANKTFALLQTSSSTSGFRLRGPDVSFLVDLSMVTGDPQYANFASAGWNNDKVNFGSGTATGFGEYIRDGRHSQGWDGLIPWDINLYVQGVKKLADYTSNSTYSTDAAALAQVIFDDADASSTTHYFNVDDATEHGYLFGLTGILSALSTVPASTTIFSADISTKLLSFNSGGAFIDLQDPEAQKPGSPSLDDHLTTIQTSAYAAMSLKQAGLNDSAQATCSYLLTEQDSTSGAWKDGTSENTEIDSEAGVALAGNITAVNTYYTIQDAINAAADGDTINVAAGTYNETLQINKPLTLNGAQAGNDARSRSGAESIIASSDHSGSIQIGSSGPVTGTVTIKGFTIGNSTTSPYKAIHVMQRTDSVDVENNIIEPSTYDGINLYSAVAGTINQNLVLGAATSGITMGNSDVTPNIITQATITNNKIEDSLYGITGYASNSMISDNDVIGNSSLEMGAGIGGQFLNTTISGNTVHGYSAVISSMPAGAGIAFDNSTPMTSRPYSSNVVVSENEVYDNAIGIYINQPLSSNNILVSSKNSVHDNTVAVVFGSSGAGTLNAAGNWWGVADETDIAGLMSPASGAVNYKPYCGDSSCASVITKIDIPESPISGAELSIPLSGTSTVTSTPSVTFLATTTVTAASGEGTSMVILPQGVVITKAGGGNIDVTAISASSTATSSISGLGTGIVSQGVLQWGIPTLGLEFDRAITLNIYVGDDLNGQTINVVRSVSGSSGWTQDGIAPPGTCVVTGGMCTFQATKASYYATVSDPTITASAGSNGSISPSGTISVPYGGSQTYTISPVMGFIVSDVTVNGSSVGALTSYTITGVDGHRDIIASFGPNPNFGSSGGGGYVPPAPAPVVTVPAPAVAAPTPTVTAPVVTAPAPVGQVLGAAAFRFTQSLGLGSRGDEVTELQNVLTQEGVYKGPVTGYFGPLTEAGVKAFQNKYGIDQAGIVGPVTRAKLNGLSEVAGASTEGQVLGASTTGTAEAVREIQGIIQSLKAEGNKEQVIAVLNVVLSLIQGK